MEYKLRNIIAVVFAFTVIFFTVLSLLSIWEFLDDEVIWKSLGTLIVLMTAAAIIYGILRILDYSTPGRGRPSPPDPMG